MKLTKIGLVAALLMEANIYAISNIHVNGAAKLFYGSNVERVKGGENKNIFSKDSSAIDTSLILGARADLTQGVTAGAELQAASTLGLNSAFAANARTGAHEKDGDQHPDAYFFSQAWLQDTLGKTTIKVGRQTFNSPLISTETWNITTNTFEAAVIKNKDLQNTTLVGAWIGASNGTGDDINATGGNISTGTVTATDGEFHSFGTNGAYVLGAINNSWKPLKAQAWYYNMQGYANSLWLQADLNINGILVGAQYVNMTPSATGAKDDNAYAGMLGYTNKDLGTLKIAYSMVDKDGTLGVANIATRNQPGGAVSAIYTDLWNWTGAASTPGANTLAISAEKTLFETDFFLAYYNCQINSHSKVLTNPKKLDLVNEAVVTAKRSFGPLDVALAFAYDGLGYSGGTPDNDDEDVATIHLNLTYNF